MSMHLNSCWMVCTIKSTTVHQGKGKTSRLIGTKTLCTKTFASVTFWPKLSIKDILDKNLCSSDLLGKNLCSNDLLKKRLYASMNWTGDSTHQWSPWFFWRYFHNNPAHTRWKFTRVKVSILSNTENWRRPTNDWGLHGICGLLH